MIVPLLISLIGLTLCVGVIVVCAAREVWHLHHDQH